MHDNFLFVQIDLRKIGISLIEQSVVLLEYIDLINFVFVIFHLQELIL